MSGRRCWDWAGEGRDCGAGCGGKRKWARLEVEGGVGWGYLLQVGGQDVMEAVWRRCA